MITITSSDHWSYWSSSIPSYDRKISNDKKVVDNLFIFQSNFIMNYPFTPCSTVQSSLERINCIVATESEEKDILKKKFQGINKKNYFFGNFIINFWKEILNIFLWFKLQIMCVCMWKHCIIIIIIINSLKKANKNLNYARIVLCSYDNNDVSSYHICLYVPMLNRLLSYLIFFFIFFDDNSFFSIQVARILDSWKMSTDVDHLFFIQLNITTSCVVRINNNNNRKTLNIWRIFFRCLNEMK